jgi:hypothetical protein
MGWEFDVFLTSDRNLSHQLNVASFEIAVLVLVAVSNRLEDLRPLVPTAPQRNRECATWLSQRSTRKHLECLESEIR